MPFTSVDVMSTSKCPQFIFVKATTFPNMPAEQLRFGVSYS
jgi:hypothetical protein